MIGPKDEENKDLKGIIPNAFIHVFESISSFGKEKRFLLRCSYLEIYNENIHDLLEYNPEVKLELKEDPQKGIYIKGLTSVIVKSVQDIERTMANGSLNRHTAETSMNKDSSRSHSIFTIYIETAETKQDGNELLRAGKLNLVDLAGSERQAKTHAEGMRLKEAAKINLSLSALGNVISALVDGKSSHIPYRDSKLTRLLQDSLGGNTKTVMIACVSPADYNYDETLSTLRYAYRAKHIQNKPHVNEDPKDALLRQYEEEIKSLRDMIEKLAKGGMGTDQLKEIENARRSMIEGNAVKSVDELQKSPGHGGDIKVKQLEEEKELLNKDKEKIESELKEREAQFLSEKEQREGLQEMLSHLEQKLVVGGHDFQEKQKEQAKKYHDMRQKLKKQRVKEKKLLEEQMKKEEEKMMVEEQYKDVQEELHDKDRLLKELRIKYESAFSEVTDLQREHQEERENLFDTIREQNQDLDFYKKVVEIMMADGEMEKIRNKAEWDDESKTWSIPLFVVQNKQVLLPKLPKSQLNELIENEKKSRALNFVQENVGNNVHAGSSKGMSHLKNQQSLSSAPNGDPKQNGGKGYSAGKSTVYGNKKDMQVDKTGGKHLFNWEILNKGKYTGNEKKQKSNDSPGAILRKNARLDSLQYNPALNLAPVDEEEVKQKVTLVNQPLQQQQAQRKTKGLVKIDESLLSSAARIQQQNEVDGHKEPPKGGMVKGRPVLPKLPFSKHDEN